MKSIVLETLFGQPLGRRHVDRTAKSAGGAKAHVVQKNDQHIGSALRRAQGLNRRKAGIWVFGIIGDQPGEGPVWNWEDLPLDFVFFAY